MKYCGRAFGSQAGKKIKKNRAFITLERFLPSIEFTRRGATPRLELVDSFNRCALNHHNSSKHQFSFGDAYASREIVELIVDAIAVLARRHRKW